MIEIVANSILDVPLTWALTPQGVGCMAYHQRWQGITLAQVLSVAESEDELWAIADGWCEAAGCDAYTDEMIAEGPSCVSWEPGERQENVPVHRYNPAERSYTAWMLPADQREDWIGE